MLKRQLEYRLRRQKIRADKYQRDCIALRAAMRIIKKQLILISNNKKNDRDCAYFIKQKCKRLADSIILGGKSEKGGARVIFDETKN